MADAAAEPGAPQGWWARSRGRAVRTAGYLAGTPYVVATATTMSFRQLAAAVAAVAAWGVGRYVTGQAAEKKNLRNELAHEEPLAAAELQGRTRQQLNDLIVSLARDKDVVEELRATRRQEFDEVFRHGQTAQPDRTGARGHGTWAEANRDGKRYATGGRVIAGMASAATVGGSMGMNPWQVAAMSAFGATVGGFAGRRAEEEARTAAVQDKSALNLDTRRRDPVRQREQVEQLTKPEAKRVAIELVAARRRVDGRMDRDRRDEGRSGGRGGPTGR